MAKRYRIDGFDGFDFRNMTRQSPSLLADGKNVVCGRDRIARTRPGLDYIRANHIESPKLPPLVSWSASSGYTEKQHGLFDFESSSSDWVWTFGTKIYSVKRSDYVPVDVTGAGWAAYDSHPTEAVVFNTSTPAAAGGYTSILLANGNSIMQTWDGTTATTTPVALTGADPGNLGAVARSRLIEQYLECMLYVTDEWPNYVYFSRPDNNFFEFNPDRYYAKIPSGIDSPIKAMHIYQDAVCVLTKKSTWFVNGDLVNNLAVKQALTIGCPAQKGSMVIGTGEGGGAIFFVSNKKDFVIFNGVQAITVSDPVRPILDALTETQIERMMVNDIEPYGTLAVLWPSADLQGTDGLIYDYQYNVWRGTVHYDYPVTSFETVRIDGEEKPVVGISDGMMMFNNSVWLSATNDTFTVTSEWDRGTPAAQQLIAGSGYVRFQGESHSDLAYYNHDLRFGRNLGSTITGNASDGRGPYMLADGTYQCDLAGAGYHICDSGSGAVDSGYGAYYISNVGFNDRIESWLRSVDYDFGSAATAKQVSGVWYEFESYGAYQIALRLYRDRATNVLKDNAVTLSQADEIEALNSADGLYPDHYYDLFVPSARFSIYNFTNTTSADFVTPHVASTFQMDAGLGRRLTRIVKPQGDKINVHWIAVGVDCTPPVELNPIFLQADEATDGDFETIPNWDEHMKGNNATYPHLISGNGAFALAGIEFEVAEGQTATRTV